MRHPLTFLLLIISSLVGAQKYESFIQKAESFESSNPDSVIFYAQKAILENVENQSDAYAWMALGLRFKNQYDSSKYWYQKALDAADSDTQMAIAKMGLGGIAYSQGSYENALTLFTEAANFFEKSGNMEKLGSAYSNIGIIMNVNDNDEKAIHYFKSSIELFDELNLETKKLPALVNLSTVYRKKEKYDSAIFYAQQCYDISLRLDFKFGQAKALVILAPSFTESGDPSRGYDFAKKGRELFEEMGAEATVRLMKLYEAEALLGLGRTEQALTICRNLEELDLEISMEEHLYRTMASIYEKMGKYELALRYQQKFHEVYEAFIDENQSKRIDELEAKFETERKETEIVLLRNEAALKESADAKKNWVIISVSTLSVFLVVAGWLFYQRRLSQERERSAIHKQQLLRSQINPHFIFNSLSSIRGFLFEGNDTKPAINYLGKFAKLMRMVLELSSKEWVSLAEEMKALELYLEIQQIRFNKAFDFELSIDKSIDPNSIMVPPLTAQPFIENAIEHGLKGMDKNGMVEIACLKEHGKLVFKIQDNGIGIDHVEPRKNHQSRAIQIFKERMGIIGHRMKMSFSFKISDIGNDAGVHGTLVTYELPILKA